MDEDDDVRRRINMLIEEGALDLGCMVAAADLIIFVLATVFYMLGKQVE